MSRIRLYLGPPGAGKTGLAVTDTLQYRKRKPLAPVCSSVPLVLPGDGPMVLARSVLHYVAFGTEISPWDLHREYQRPRLGLADRLGAGWDRVVNGRGSARGSAPRTDYGAKVEDFVSNLQAEVSRAAGRGKKAAAEVVEAHNRILDDCIARHNERVLAGWKPGLKPSEFKFQYNKHPFESICLIDEGGIVTGSGDWRELSSGPFYEWLAQVRKLGVRMYITAHSVDRVAKSLREIVDEFRQIKSFQLGARRIYIYKTFNNLKDYEARENGAFGFQVVHRSVLNHYATMYIVPSIPTA